MPPQEPTPGQIPPVQSAPGAPSQYDFIMNYGGSKRPVVPQLPAQSSLVGRLLIVGGGAFILLIVVWIFFGVILAKHPSVDPTTFMSLAQRQNELVRISGGPINTASNQPTKNFAETTILALQTDQTALLNLMTKNGIKVDPKLLSATQSSQTDSQLQAAQSNGTYDQTYLSIAQSQLQSYQRALQNAARTTHNAAALQLLQNDYDNAKLLLALSSQTE